MAVVVIECDVCSSCVTRKCSLGMYCVIYLGVMKCDCSVL